MVKWLSVRLRPKWLWVQVPLQSLKSSDCSNQEQLSLVIKFVGGSGEIREELLGFLHCELGLFGKVLAEIVLNGVANLTLDIHNCRGQGYDGASCVSDYINGLSAEILCINEEAIYTHCRSHRLIFKLLGMFKPNERAFLFL